MAIAAWLASRLTALVSLFHAELLQDLAYVSALLAVLCLGARFIGVNGMVHHNNNNNKKNTAHF
jgi:hypothetical protein